MPLLERLSLAQVADTGTSASRRSPSRPAASSRWRACPARRPRREFVWRSMCENVWLPSGWPAARQMSRNSAVSGESRIPFALMKPYVAGAFAAFRVATMLRATSERAGPGGKGRAREDRQTSARASCARPGRRRRRRRKPRRGRSGRETRRIVDTAASLTRASAAPAESKPESRADFQAAPWYRFHWLPEER